MASELDSSDSILSPHAPATSVSRDIIETAESILVSRIPRVSREHDTSTNDEGEETLEWHEVIELQAFSERRAWIEDKIKLLEQMPPIEVFACLDAVRSSSEPMEGLPSREELEQWLIEHDKIEKETEIFDSGELQKLRKVTKAATQRNLSPEDTDLIELTLTTIHALDKLIHLLRDRSENLDLLGTRLIWEERRINAWIELQNVITDISHFLRARARWSPDVYEQIEESGKDDELNLPLPSLRRKTSSVSIASVASDTATSSSSAAFSRMARYKYSEVLSREAAKFSSRVSSLRYSKINAAGTALDKLIDDSRRPIPDELLDEQDRLEDKGINEMEDVGKFIMNVIMQWKKADEFYVETTNDKTAAQTLLEDIDFASSRHPTPRQDATFMSRANALNKRLAMRGDPLSSTSLFPRPSHPLFEDQTEYNQSTLKLLSSEYRSALEIAAKAEKSAKQYHTTMDAVRKVETVCKAASQLHDQLASLITSLEKGTENENGDGSPPDLSSERCLQSTRHSVFLAFFPSLSEQVEKLNLESSDLLEDAHLAMLDLSRPGIDPQFVSDSKAEIMRLANVRKQLSQVFGVAKSRVSTLSEVRRIWANMEDVFMELENSRQDLCENIEKSMWQSQTRQDALLTPESSVASLVTPVEESSTPSRLQAIGSRVALEVSKPLSAVSPSIHPNLNDYLQESSALLTSFLRAVEEIASLLDSVHNQATAMTAVQEEVNDLQLRMEDLSNRLDVGAQNILSGQLVEDELAALHTDIDADLSKVQDAVRSLLDSLPQRVPFVAKTAASTKYHTHLRHSSVSGPFSLDILRQRVSVGLPVDPQAIDRAVRADCNTYSMHLSGAAEALAKHALQFRLAKTARAIDVTMQSLTENMQRIESIHSSARESFLSPCTTVENLTELIVKLNKLVEVELAEYYASLNSARGQLSVLEEESSGLDSDARTSLVSARKRAFDEAQARYTEKKAEIEQLARRISEAEVARREEEARLKEEERLAREAAEAERERLVAEQQAKEARLREEAERERLEAEAASSKLLPALVEDVFGVDSSEPIESLDPDLVALQERIYSLRTRLRSLGIADLSTGESNSLPLLEKCTTITNQLSNIQEEMGLLPCSMPENGTIDAELRSLRTDVNSSTTIMARMNFLAKLRTAVDQCDNALSDLLEHLDSYPSQPMGNLSSLHVSDPTQSAEQQLQARLRFTEDLVNAMRALYDQVKEDPRAVSEFVRVTQTWTELQAMCQDRLTGQKSRPASVVSNGRNSHASTSIHPNPKKSKPSGYSKLSVGSPGGQFLVPPPPSARRASSTSRSSSRMSAVSTASSNRSVSGPVTATSRLFQSTFASRQRTQSVTSNASTATPPTKPIPIPTSRRRANTASRTASPAFSDVSTFSQSRSSLNLSRSSHSTWSRAPRMSLSTLPQSPTPRARGANGRKRYVPNPKSKLDMAVGEVVNQLPSNVDINIEAVVADTWKDQSGKYWIGSEDPKLCFCRILRSQTVMVRVGGGWTELSKFIKEHVADAFRLLPESPPRAKMREEKWINSATLTQAAQEASEQPAPPQTPEPPATTVPDFALSTPSGRSPKSIGSPPTPGSPLTAMQFIRRADRDSPLFRSETPTKSSRSVVIPPATPRLPAWRP